MKKKNWREDIIRKYPMLFRQKDLPMTETCLCWGIDCGYGWSTILDRTCQRLMNWWEDYEEKNRSVLYWKLEFVQIKEKYGRLRIYTNCDGLEQVSRITDDAETASAFICEDCGTSIGTEIKGVRGEGSWILALCRKCRKDRNKWRLKWWIRQQWLSVKWKVRKLFLKKKTF